MGKTLKICLAMGGGVSLGSFSGAGLTESLKLLLLYGQDKDGSPYDRIVVDGMSGASAGAIALTIMLKCLIDPEKMIKLLKPSITIGDIETSLVSVYFNGKREKFKTHKHYKKLLAVEVAQRIQKQIWVDEVSSKKLLAPKLGNNHKVDPDSGFSLLDRKILEELTMKYLLDTTGFNIKNRQLLADDRVIFACSLTNLLPMEINLDNKNLNKLESNVLKSTGSQNHSELRVIDFIFEGKGNENKSGDNNWIHFYENDSTDIQSPKYDLKNSESWGLISASALACGAFPLAFEPVLLHRMKSEFGKNQWPKGLEKVAEEIKNAKNTGSFDYRSFIGNEDLNNLDYNSFNFPYIDGGTFNNEPIKEAFRIGAYQDFNNDSKDVERMILFVDPIVRDEDFHSFRMRELKSIKRAAGQNEWDITSESSKLFGTVGGIINVLSNQGSIKEEHKILDVKENFKLRDTIFSYLDSNDNLGENLKISVLKSAFDKIGKNLSDGAISIGTRNPIEYFLSYFHRTCKQVDGYSAICDNISRTALEEIKRRVESEEGPKFDENKPQQIYDILGIDANDIKSKNIFARTVLKLVFDFSLNIAGKNREAYRVAVLPLDNKLDISRLPGVELMAFGGFASIEARKYAFEYARLSALISLESKEGFREFKGKPVIEHEILDDLKSNFEKELDSLGFYLKYVHYSKKLNENLIEPAFKRILRIFVNKKYISKFLKLPFPLAVFFGALVLPFVTLYLGIKKGQWNTKKILDEIITKLSNEVNFQNLPTITVTIKSDKKLDRRFNLLFENGEKQTIHAKQIDTKRSQDNFRYDFELAILEYPKINPSNEKSEKSEEGYFAPSEIQQLALSTDLKVRLPEGVDRNLNYVEWESELLKNYPSPVKIIEIGKELSFEILSIINNKYSSIYYSLKYHSLHLNPVLQIDLSEPNPQWIFLERTESLDRKFQNYLIKN